MGFFDSFRKKKPDVMLKKPGTKQQEVHITALQKGFSLQFKNKTWVVISVYEYDWGDDFLTVEYKLDCGEDVIYLHVEEDEERVLSTTRKISVKAFGENIQAFVAENEHPPITITYDNKEFFLGEENSGHFRDTDGDTWEEFRSWDYCDETEEFIICIVEWEDDDFEVSFGRVIKESEISRIIQDH